MGRAIEVVTGFVTAPGATFTAWTLAAGNSLTVRNSVPDTPVHLLDMWAHNQAAGTLRVRSPRLHDNVQGIRSAITVGLVAPLLPYRPRQRLIAQDQLVAEQTGSAVGGDIETGALLLYYENLPGVEGRFVDVDTVVRRAVTIENVENTIATGIAGGYSGEEAINAEFDLLKANTDYALLGYLVAQQCAVVRWRGSDTGNLGVGGPGEVTLRHLTKEWFLRLSRDTGFPCIPVFNSANKGAVLVDCAQNELGVDVTVTSIFAELGPTGTVVPR